MLHGYDISNVNGDIVIPGDAEFVICKVSQDASFVDRKFQDFREVARQREIGFGGYHYADPKEQPDPRKSCDFFLSLLGEQHEGEIAALDVEQDSGYGGFEPNTDYNRDWVLEWGLRFTVQTGYKPYLYTSRAGIQDFDLNNPAIAELYHLWYAYWTDSSLGPASPPPWQDYKLWQYNADQIDKNKFFGTLEEFKATGKKIAPQSFDYEARLWTPMQNLLNDLVANSSDHADLAFHAAVSNNITIHKIARGVESMR